MITQDLVLRGLFLGMLFGVLTVAYNKLVLGRLIKALIKAEAVHPNFAKSFEELNLKKNIFFIIALRKSGTMRKFVVEPEDETRKGFYYIPEDKLYRAQRMYGGKDADLLMVAAVIITMFIFFTILLLVLPFFSIF